MQESTITFNCLLHTKQNFVMQSKLAAAYLDHTPKCINMFGSICVTKKPSVFFYSAITIFVFQSILPILLPRVHYIYLSYFMEMFGISRDCYHIIKTLYFLSVQQSSVIKYVLSFCLFMNDIFYFRLYWSSF